MKPLPPSVVNAGRWIGLLQICAWLGFAVGCGAAMAIAVLYGDPKTAGATAMAALPLLVQIAASGFLAGACFLPAWLVVAARARVAGAAETLRTAETAPTIAATPMAEREAFPKENPAAAPPALPAPIPSPPEAQLDQALADLARRAGWQQLLLIAPPAIAALALAWWSWPFALAMNDGRWGLGLVAVIAAFPVLVLERRLSAVPAAILPEAPALARMLRLTMWSLLGAGCCTLLAAYGFGFARYGMLALAALTIAVAGELALRGASAVFLPPAGPDSATALGDSAIADLIFARLDPLRGIGGGLKERFGIDLSQSWAMRFVRRAALPLALVLLAIAWALSALTALAVNERGVYEAWGVPVAVYGPGLHLHLPWPFGQVRRVEFGLIHTVNLGADAKDSAPLRVDEDPDPAWDRLWDRSHPRDSYFLVPGPKPEQQDDRGQGLHLINCDIGVIYRVGLTDQDALNSCYSLAEPAVEVASRATRLLTHEFGRVPVDRVIAEDRDALRERLRAALQAGLDADHSGLEITAVVIDAIHPPVATALAYHGVQAAEIIASTDIYRAKSERARGLAEADRDAAATRYNGQAEAGELVSKATVDLNVFSADAQAYASGGRAYVLERWLTALARSLREGRLLIIDHRLDAGDAATLDLRRFAPILTPDK